MSEFIQTFSFVFFPFFVMVAFASILPAAGCALYIRNEMMLSIALPPLTGAALTLGVYLGVSPENHFVLLALSFSFSFSVVMIIGYLRLLAIQRQIFLASLFAGGSILIHLLMSISPDVHAHLGFLLSGELLALDGAELLQTLLLCAFCWVAFLTFRNAVFSYCIDEEMMQLRTVYFRLFSLSYRLLVVVLISASVLFIGPLLTSALLIFPSLLADTRKNSIASFFTLGIIAGLIGSIGGFMAGIAVDIPPAYTAAMTILVVGIALRFYISVLVPLTQKKQSPSPVPGLARNTELKG